MALRLIQSDATHRHFEHEVTRLLADGRLDAVTEQLDGRGPTPFTELVELDVRSRLLGADLSELQLLQERLLDDHASQTRFGLWAEAMVAERMLLDGDPASARWAVTVLDGVTVEPYPPVPILFARARLRRLAAINFLAEPTPANRASFRVYRDGAVEDFVRCGFQVEAAVTAAVGASMSLLRTHDEPRQSLDRIAAARAALDGLDDSACVPVVAAAAGMAAMHVGDAPAALAAFGDADEAYHHPVAAAASRFGRALIGLVLSAGDPAHLPAIDAVIDEAGRAGVHHAGTLQSIMAHALADFGRPEMARYARPAVDRPRQGTLDEFDERLLRLRADLVAGVVHPAGDVKALLGELVDLQLRRWAGVCAVRIARDYERLDQRGEGESLRQWGLDLLPPPSERTFSEQVLSAPLDAPPIRARSPKVPTRVPARAAERGTPTTVVRVLEPSLMIEIDGTAVALRETGAKLLLALVIRHPRPMHIEEVADLLWPGTPPADVRSRLNSLVHRLRSAAPALGPAVRRTGDLLAFDENRCGADLLQYRDHIGGTPDERRAALLAVHGNLCESQFPYDEPLVDERHSFTAAWLDTARALVDDGAVTAADLARPLAALSLEPGDLV